MGLPDVMEWPPAIVASLIAAAVATFGVVVVVLRDEWATRHQVHFTAFAAGILVTTALMLFPEAVKATRWAPFFVLAGYLLLYGINVIFRTANGTSVLTPLLAIGLHSFIDGFEYGILFDHDIHMGVVASIGLITHEFAEGVILFAVLRAAGVGVFGAFIGSFLGAAVTTPAGAVTSQMLIGMVTPEVIGATLSMAAGALLYVGATHLPTHLTKGSKSLVALFYILGVALSLMLSMSHMDGDHGAQSNSTNIFSLEFWR